MKFYRAHWFYFTIIVFVLLSFYMGFWGIQTLKPLSIILIYSFMALLVHQFEEYVLPGGGPVVINKANFNETDNFRRYPGNMNSAMLVNTSAYIFYGAAIVFPHFIWLGLATMFFNLFQFWGHGIKMNQGMKTWYNPGLATVVFLFIPLSFYYMIFITTNHLATGSDWLGGIITFFAATVFTTILPVQLLKDKNSIYAIPEWQVECCDKVQAFASLQYKEKNKTTL